MEDSYVEGHKQEARVAVPRESTAARKVRGWVRHCLEQWGAGPSAIERAILVASELVTNAFKYGHGRIEVRLQLGQAAARIEVIDEGSDQVLAVREQPEDRTSGWGLQIVDSLSARWGVFEGTTHVWADLPLED
jgi:anti-sigma regulatory factor (Ser/Thr protein kinase)